MTILDPLQPILAIDCSTENLSVAVQSQQQTFSIHEKVKNQHSDKLIPFIHQLLTEAKLKIEHLKAIVYVCGPGSFTGLRIGLSVAKGLAMPFKIPLIAISTLDYIAYQAIKLNLQGRVSAFLDARMDEVFFAQYQTNPFQRITEFTILKKETINQKTYDLAQASWLGNIFENTTIKESIAFPIIKKMPQASLLFEMVDNLSYHPESAENAELLYIRNKIALTEKERSDAKIRS